MRLFVMFITTIVITMAAFRPASALDIEPEKLEISVYNNNLALVKDTRRVALRQGANDVAFEGVASQIKPESVMILGEAIKVLEQNYDYELLTAANILDKSVGQQVKTVIQNPQTGANVFDKAKLISAVYGNPILQFDYGIEANFPGRIIYDELPESLRTKPTLAAKIFSTSAALKSLTLAYLTNGMSWKINYVANVGSDESLDLTGWVALQNESGVNYEKAKIQLVAGQVNEIQPMRPLAASNRKMTKAAGAFASELAMEDGAAPDMQQVSAYYVYTLPQVTDLNNQQTKQVSLVERRGVKYEQEGRLRSSLYFHGDAQASFEKLTPNLFYLTKNDEQNNLGLPLPSGVVRFYADDKDGSMQFIGEDYLRDTAKGEKMEFNLGKMFDVYANGKIVKANKISENRQRNQDRCENVQQVWSYDVVVDFYNGGSKDYDVLFSQNINKTTRITQQNLEGKAKSAYEHQWRVNVPAEGSFKLEFTVQTHLTERQCSAGGM